jgi:asparagine synthase (glutamine-hydrolysing)
MSFVVAAATGTEAVVDLQRLVDGQRSRGDVHLVVHEDVAVAWNTRHRWVSSCDDGDVLVVLDGQLHNLFSEERPSVALLLERYRSAGEELARGLLGDFVIVVLDRTRAALVVCRDPVGVRPWYQATSGRRHAGASTAATLCALPWVDQSIDEEVAVAYLAGRMESRGRTFHRGIATLPPGSIWRAAGRATAVLSHHRWDIRPEPEVEWDEAVHRSRSLLDEVVRDRVRAAGAATSELSGGLDSSGIVGTAVLLGNADVLVGRLLFDPGAADERRYSDAVIAHWGITAVSARPWLPTEDELSELSALLRRPVPDPNVMTLRALHRRLAAEGRSSGLTGVGGDDAFVATSTVSRVVSAVQQHSYRDLAPMMRADLCNPREGWRRTWRPLLGRLRRRGIRPPPAHVARQAAESFGLTQRLGEPMVRLTGVDAVDERADVVTSGHTAYIMEELAIAADLNGWRSSHPFLDPRLITATYGLNPSFAVRHGHDRALQVAVLADRLPPAVRERRSKAEFSEVMWTGCPRGIPTVEEIVRGPLGRRGWLDVSGTDQLINAARERRPASARLFARVVALDRWLRLTD